MNPDFPHSMPFRRQDPVPALPCPFCGSREIRFDRHGPMYVQDGGQMIPNPDLMWSTCCYQCGATFPNRRSLDALLACWDRRPAQPATTPPPPTTTGKVLFAVGQRVEFIGYRAASFEYADIKPGDRGTIESVKQPHQAGMDYGVKMDSGYRSMLDHNEVKPIPTGEDDYADMDLRAWTLMVSNPRSTCESIKEQLRAEFGADRLAAHIEFCRKRIHRLKST